MSSCLVERGIPLSPQGPAGSPVFLFRCDTGEGTAVPLLCLGPFSLEKPQGLPVGGILPPACEVV